MSVAVFYDGKVLVKMFISSICGCNKKHFHNGIHAEQKALQYMKTHKIKKPTLLIFQLRTREGNLYLKKIDICSWCEQIINKIGKNIKIYTVNDDTNILKEPIITIKADYMGHPSKGDRRLRLMLEQNYKSFQ